MVAGSSDHQPRITNALRVRDEPLCLSRVVRSQIHRLFESQALLGTLPPLALLPRAHLFLPRLPSASLPLGDQVSTAALDTIQPLHVFAWIVDSGLRDSLKSLAHALLRRVDRHSWRWPRRRGDRGGVTVAELADGAGLSRRHAARCLRTLEVLGLVRTTFRPFEVSEYALIPGAWRDLAQRHQSRRDERRARHRSDRIERYQAWREAQAAQTGAPRAEHSETPHAGGNAAPSPAQPAPSDQTEAQRQDALPTWAHQHASRLRAPSNTVFQVVGGAAAAILGDGVNAQAQGGLARPVLKLWDGRGRPEPSVLAEELRLVASWARESVHPDALRLRGQGPRGDGVDASTDARRICDPVVFSRRLVLARGHAEAQQPRQEHPPPAASVPPGIWVPPELSPPAEPHIPPDPGDAWTKAVASLRRQAGGRAGELDAFFSPMQVTGLRGGVLLLRPPSDDVARWVVQWMLTDLEALAELLGCGIGFVPAQ